MSKLQYENVFKGRMGALYARLYNPETKTTETKTVKSIPSIYINAKDSSEDTGYISIPEKKPLNELKFKTMKDYRETFKLYKDSGVSMYGNKSQEQTYIRENWPNPIECYHDFSNIWFWDIETAVGLQEDIEVEISEEDYKLAIEKGIILYNNIKDKKIKISLSQLEKFEQEKIQYKSEKTLKEYKTTMKSDWKPTSHERAAMATITSIQIYDTKMKTFFIFALNKDWTRQNIFESNHGPVKYIKCVTEEEMLKKFLELLRKRDPAVMSGWNTAGYDDPFVTNRVIRVLDKREDLYYYDKLKQMWKFNTDCLNGEYVKQLSPHAGLIQHKEVQTNFGIQDEYKWVGIIQEDYLNLYKKYTYTIHTSYSLDTVAGYELGSAKINHDEHTDFREFYENNFDTFIEYGLRDTELLIEIDKKLKLMDLAKFIAYTCGVTMEMIHGTVRQWNNYMYNNHLNKKQVLPLEGKFGHTDTTVMNHAVNMKDIDEDRRQNFKRLLSSEETHGQTFPGGITRGTGKFWKEVFSLDFGSLYPSAIQWANIGIETLIEPKDLPEELLDLRARYANFYPKDVAPKDLIQFDFRFANNILGNETIRKEIEETLNKYNVCMTPNGMFFKLDQRSVLSQTMEDIIVQRKVHKKNMLNTYREIEKLKSQDSYDKDKIQELNSLADMYNVYQMGLKILINSAYGALSMQSTVFAGDKEYFSGAVTSSARIANLIAGQANSKKVDEIAGVESSEIQYGEHSYQDNIPQIDTDSVVGDSIVYVNGEKIKIEDCYEKYSGSMEKRGINNYIKHINEEIYTLSLNKEKNILENKKIKYIMVHKVNKRMFKIKHDDNEVIVTEDHSIIVKREGSFVDVKPKDIIKGDKIIKVYKRIIGLEADDFIVEDLRIQEQWVYDLEVEDNHNFFANDICVHNSNYISIQPVVEKKFGVDYRDNIPRARITEFIENYINKVSLPLTYKTLGEYSKTMNAYLPEKLVEDPEVICDNFISIAPKMYMARKWWDEGLTLTKPKMKVTGLSMVRASTPKFFRQELASAMEILIDGDVPKVIEYMKDVRLKTDTQAPSQICINQGVSSLDYEWQESSKKFKRWVPEKEKWLSAPVNSRASLVHNKYIADKNLTEIKDIEPGNKIGFLYMKEPNITLSNAFAFNNEKVFDYGLVDYIDREMMYQKGFENNIKLITDPIGWDLTPQEDLIDEDEW